MNSGIEIPDEILTQYKLLAFKRKIRYIIYKPTEDMTSIEIEKIGEREETFENFKESVPKELAR